MSREQWVAALAGVAVAFVLAAVALAVYEVLTTPALERPTRLLTAAVGFLVASVVAYSALVTVLTA